MIKISLRILCILYLFKALFLYFLLPSKNYNYNPPINNNTYIKVTWLPNILPFTCRATKNWTACNLSDSSHGLFTCAWLRIGQFVLDQFICNAGTNLILRMCNENIVHARRSFDQEQTRISL